MKVIKWLDEHFEETFLVFFLVLISCITMLQIIARTFFAALSWRRSSAATAGSGACSFPCPTPCARATCCA